MKLGQYSNSEDQQLGFGLIQGVPSAFFLDPKGLLRFCGSPRTWPARGLLRARSLTAMVDANEQLWAAGIIRPEGGRLWSICFQRPDGVSNHEIPALGPRSSLCLVPDRVEPWLVVHNGLPSVTRGPLSEPGLWGFTTGRWEKIAGFARGFGTLVGVEHHLDFFVVLATGAYDCAMFRCSDGAAVKTCRRGTNGSFVLVPTLRGFTLFQIEFGDLSFFKGVLNSVREQGIPISFGALKEIGKVYPTPNLPQPTECQLVGRPIETAAPEIRFHLPDGHWSLPRINCVSAQMPPTRFIPLAGSAPVVIDLDRCIVLPTRLEWSPAGVIPWGPDSFLWHSTSRWQLTRLEEPER